MRTDGKMWMLACGLAGVLSAAPALAETVPAGTPSPATTPTPTSPGNPTPAAAALPTTNYGDPTWVTVKLHKINQMEIQAGKAELAKGESAKVKSYASHLVRDHQAADRQLMTYARQHKISLRGSEFGPAPNNDNNASQEDSDDQQMRSDLKALKQHSGRDMDQAFLTAMISGHDKAITMVNAARAALTDTDLTAILDHLLPTLQRHRDMAATLNNSINGTSSIE